jgi:acyl-coenzyme A thioesterase PaaI-like protein
MSEYSIGAVLASAVRPGDGGRGRFHAPALLQSWPGIVHGGGLVALLDAAGGVGGPRTVEGRLTTSVPVERVLDLEARADAGGAAVAVLEGGQPLSAVTVTPLAGAGPAAPPWTGGAGGLTLPMSERCLVCGADNALGLRLALRLDAVGVWARLDPPGAWRRPGGEAHPALAAVLLDEVGWWLGAATMQEGGLTNRVAVSYLRAALGPGPFTAAGRLVDVVAVDRKRSFWRTTVALWDGAGAAVAVGSVVFRGGPEYSERQLPFFRARSDPATFRRLFGAATG